MRKKFKSLLAVSAAVSMLVAFAACGDKETNADPSSTPTPTEAPSNPTEAPTPTEALQGGDLTPTETPATPTPTEAPEPTQALTADGKVIIHNITGEAKRDTLYFGQRGGAAVWWGEIGCNSDGSIQVNGRSASWHGVSLGFTDASNNSYDVIGKEVYVSFDFYQETGAPLNFNCTLEVKKQDGTTMWPERVPVEAPSGEWVHVEGMIPVYANATSPVLNFETFDGGETAEFFLDNVVVSYDPNSSVDPNPDYDMPAKKAFEPVSLDFSGEDTYFVARGDSVPTIVDGAMYVGGRTSSWNGAQVKLSDYELAGKTMTISYKAKHDEAGPIEINVTMEESDGTNDATYNRVASSGEVAPGEWVTVTGTYTILETTTVPILYFEATETSSFYIDDVTITVE